MYSDNVAECWGDSDAAAALGIRTYVSAPIRSLDRRVLGAVCAASSKQVARAPDVEPLLLLSGLLSYSLERELLVERLQVANAELATLALPPLTGVPSSTIPTVTRPETSFCRA
jgi:diguanylate cyclase